MMCGTPTSLTYIPALGQLPHTLKSFPKPKQDCPHPLLNLGNMIHITLILILQKHQAIDNIIIIT